MTTLPREDGLLPSPCFFLLWPAFALILPPMAVSGELQRRQQWGGGVAQEGGSQEGGGGGQEEGRGKEGGEGEVAARVWGEVAPPLFGRPPLMGLVASPKVGSSVVARGPGCQKNAENPL